MFESISFCRQDNYSQKPINIGQLVECMLFYQKVYVIANSLILKQILNFFGIARTIDLFEEGLLNIVFTESFTGVQTKNNTGIEFHQPVIFTSPQHTFEQEIRKICIELLGKEGAGRRSAIRLEKYIPVIRHDNDVVKDVEKIFLNQELINTAAKTVIKNLIPGLQGIEKTRFNTQMTESGIVVETNLDFSKINEQYHKIVPTSHSSVKPAYILSLVSDAEHDLNFASKYLSEISTNNISSDLISNRITHLIEKSKKSQQVKSDFFQNFVFDSANALQDAVNSGWVDVDMLLTVLKRSKKHKNWLANIRPEQNLLKEYYNDVTKDSFVDKLPGKSMRWVLFTGAGMAADTLGAGGIGTVTGLTLSVVDTFLIDKLLHGWRPNQFIENDVRKLVQKK